MNKKLIFGILIVIAVASLATCVYYFIQYKNYSDFEINQKAYQKVLDERNSVKYWQTYTNEKYGFELKFPPAWGNVTEIDGESFGHKNFTFDVKNPSWTIFDITIVDEDYWKSCEDDQKYVDEHPEEGYVACELYYVAKRGKDVFVWSKPNDFPNEHEQKFKDIPKVISTFKFIPPVLQEDISTWKTYTNTQYGFSIKYPSSWAFQDGTSDEMVYFYPPSQMPSGDSDVFIDSVSIKQETNCKNIDWRDPNTDEKGLEFPLNSHIKHVCVSSINSGIEMSARSEEAMTLENQMFSTFKLLK